MRYAGKQLFKFLKLKQRSRKIIEIKFSQKEMKNEKNKIKSLIIKPSIFHVIVKNIVSYPPEIRITLNDHFIFTST